MTEEELALLKLARRFTHRTVELWAFVEAKTAKGSGLTLVYEHAVDTDPTEVVPAAQAA